MTAAQYSFIGSYFTFCTKQLNAVYAGPFISKEFLNDNIEEIYKLSEATEGEVEQWKG